MSQVILLDSAPLGLISNPHSSPVNDACNQWLQQKLQAGVLIAISDWRWPHGHRCHEQRPSSRLVCASRALGGYSL